jgi:formylglycine-generating enzyme required for sulfatase activity
MANDKSIAGTEETLLPLNKRGKNYFLGIGINDYEKCTKLNNAVKDIEDFKTLLVEKYDFEEKNTKIVSNTDAKRENIFQTLRVYLQNLESNDNLIFYFSGHGELDRVLNEGYWIPFEAQKGAWHEYISNAEIRTYLNAMPCKHLFLIVDSCFSGSLFLSKNAKKIDADRRETEPSRWALTAGRTELVDDGEPGENSPFAKWLLNILQKNDKPLSVSLLCASVKELVIPNSNQTPRGEPMNIKGHEGGEFVFHLSESEEQKENRIWAKALAENTEKSFNSYLSLYRKGAYAMIARQKSKDLAIEADFAKAKKIDKAFAYHDFLDRYEDEEHPRLVDAELRIKTLEVDVKSIQNEKNTIIQAPNIIIPKKLEFEPELVFVKGGTFMMGSNDGNIYEQPIHEVKVDGFYIGKYPVMQKEWKAIMGNNPSHFKGDNLPVESVSWEDTKVFLQKINEKTKKKYRLPTEAEWEYAARGGDKSKGFIYSGSNDIEEVAWYEKNADYKTHTVGTKKSNELGIYDMSGNVWEWCEDWYDADYYAKSLKQNPKGADSSSFRVARGGSGACASEVCRVAVRGSVTPEDCFNDLGIRIIFPVS